MRRRRHVHGDSRPLFGLPDELRDCDGKNHSGYRADALLRYATVDRSLPKAGAGRLPTASVGIRENERAVTLGIRSDDDAVRRGFRREL